MAKYISVDELEKFEFHDARFRSVRINGQCMEWELDYVNVTTKNSQNHFDVDMEAGTLFLTFQDYHIGRFEFYPAAVEKEAGKFELEPSPVIAQSEYPDWILKAGSENGTLLYGGITKTYEKGPCHSFDFLINLYAFGIDLEYSHVKAEWDAYEQKAWYVGR